MIKLIPNYRMRHFAISLVLGLTASTQAFVAAPLHRRFASALRSAPICLSQDPTPEVPSGADLSASSTWSRTPSGLRFVDETVGREPTAAPQVLSVRFEGSLLSDGRRVEIDGRSSPLTIVLGEDLPVLQEMLSGMRVGGTRRVLLPPSADINPESGTGEIAADDTIRFELEV